MESLQSQKISFKNTINFENLKFLRTNNGGLSKRDSKIYFAEKKKKDILSNKF